MKSFIIHYNVYNIHVIITLNYLFIKIQIFKEQNIFYFFLHFPGLLQVTEFINRLGKASKISQNYGIFFDSANYNYNPTIIIIILRLNSFINSH